MALDKEDIQVELRKLETVQFESKRIMKSLKEEVEDLESAFKGPEASKVKIRLLEEISTLEKNANVLFQKNKEGLSKLYQSQVEKEEEDGDTI